MSASRSRGAAIFAAFALANLGLALRAPGAQAATAADERIISLPPLMVEEVDRALQWRYVARPGYEVLSVCDDATTLQFEERQMRLTELMEVVLPKRFQVQIDVPEAVVLFNEETGRSRSRELVNEMVRKAGATVTSDGVVRAEGLARGAGIARADGIRVTRPGLGQEPPRIQFLPNMRLTDADAVRVFAIIADAGANRMDFMFAYDRVAFLLARRTPALPDWFLVGMLGVYKRMRVDEHEIEFRPLIWRSEEESAALLRDPDWPRTLLPMREIFTRQPVGGGGPPTTEVGQIWQEQSALFVRWALADPTGVRREALWQWLDRLDVGPPTEETFRACFGCGFADMRDRLSDYLPSAVKTAVTLKGPKPGARPPLKLRAATDLEIASIRGDWERLEIAQVRQRYPALTDRYVDQARRTVRRVYDRGVRDPQLLAVMGLIECDAGNPAGARGALEAAVRGGVVRPRVYLELARLRYQEITAGDPDRRLALAEARPVLELLRQAHRAAPPLPEIYLLAGKVWLQTDGPATEEDLAMMSDAVRLFPSAAGIVLGAINLHATRGLPGPAAAFARIGWQNARDATTRERFARIQADLAKLPK